MSDPLDPISDPSPEEIAAVEALLARAGADGVLWSDLPPDLEDRIVASIAHQSTGATSADSTPATVGDRNEGSRVRSLDQAGPERTGRRDARRDFGVPWWLGAAAAIALVVTGIALVTRSGDDGGAGGGDGDDAVEFTLAGTDAAPGARADVVMSSTPAGLKILLDADGLSGAPEGTYYEAWLSDGDVRVSAGTFHLRGGSNEIELWAGVVGPEFDTLTVTVEPVDADNGSSGDVVMRGTLDG
jgi:hypothetical protein